MEDFEIAGGSVTGRDHITINKPNQDSYDWIKSDEFIIATICDGCGSRPHSEVGARLGSKLFNTYLLQNFKRLNLQSYDKFKDSFIQTIEIATLFLVETLRKLAVDMSFKPLCTINDHFLFTIITVIITKEFTGITIIGDGVYHVDETTVNSESKSNTPYYPIYKLMGKPFEIQDEIIMHNSTWKFLSIGSDGCTHLINAAEKNVPGKNNVVGALEQFKNDKYYKNTDMVRRRLAQINKTTQRIDWENKKINVEHGHLKDDTTLISIRRNTDESK